MVRFIFNSVFLILLTLSFLVALVVPVHATTGAEPLMMLAFFVSSFRALISPDVFIRLTTSCFDHLC